MAKKENAKKVEDFDDLFEDSFDGDVDFDETAESIKEEIAAEDTTSGEDAGAGADIAGTKTASKSSKKAKLNFDKKSIILYALIGGVLLFVGHAMYRVFVPAQAARAKQGVTRGISSHRPPVRHKVSVVKPVAKPAPKKVAKPAPKKVFKPVETKAPGILIDKKGLDAILNRVEAKNQLVMSKAQSVLTEQLNKTYAATQKDIKVLNTQLNLLSKNQNEIANKQQQNSLVSASSLSSLLSKNHEALNKNTSLFDRSIAIANKNTDKIAKEEKVVEDNHKVLLEQNKHIKALVTEVDNMNKRFELISNAIIRLNQSMVQTQMSLKLIIAQKAQDAQKLTLRAVVPGRAWMVDGKGRTVTVSEGTELPYYGKVVSIDSKSNMVKMSTGFVFK